MEGYDVVNRVSYMSTSNLAGKKSKQYKKFSSIVDDRKSKLAKEFHHEIFPLKPDIFDGDLALVIKDSAIEILAALINDVSVEKWAVLQFCILLWSDSMGKSDSKLDDLVKLALNSKPEDGMPILALAVFSSGTFKSLNLNLDQQVAFTCAALSLIVATAPYLHNEIQSIRRNELWAHGGQIFTLALGDRFLPSHFCWSRCRNIVQVLLDSVLKNYMPDLVQHLGFSYATSKSTAADPRIMDALATPYLNLIVHQPLPQWLSILKFKLHNDFPHESKFGEQYKLIWNSAVGMVCQVALKLACEYDLKLNQSDPKWGWTVLQRWLQDPQFRLFWHDEKDNDVVSCCQILNKIRADTMQPQALNRIIFFVRGLVQRSLTLQVDWDSICSSAIHVFQSVLLSINENAISTFEKLALSESFATLFLILPFTTTPSLFLSKIENVKSTYFVDYVIERWSDITHSAFIKSHVEDFPKLELFQLTKFKLYKEQAQFMTTDLIGDPQWAANWYYPYTILNNVSESTSFLMMDFFATGFLKSSITSKRIICKTQVKMILKIVLQAWATNESLQPAYTLISKYIFKNNLFDLLLTAPDTNSPILFLFDLFYQINQLPDVQQLSDAPYSNLIKAMYSNGQTPALESHVDTIWFTRITRDLDLNLSFSFVSKYITLYLANDKEIIKKENASLICTSLKAISLHLYYNKCTIDQVLEHSLIHSHSEDTLIISTSIDVLYTVLLKSPSNANISFILSKSVACLEEQVRILLVDDDFNRVRLIERIAMFLVEACQYTSAIDLLVPVLNALHGLSFSQKVELKTLSHVACTTFLQLYKNKDGRILSYLQGNCITTNNAIILASKNKLQCHTAFHANDFEIIDTTVHSKVLLETNPLGPLSPALRTTTKKGFKRSETELVKQALEK